MILRKQAGSFKLTLKLPACLFLKLQKKCLYSQKEYEPIDCFFTISRQMPDRRHRQAPEQYTNARSTQDQ